MRIATRIIIFIGFAMTQTATGQHLLSGWTCDPSTCNVIQPRPHMERKRNGGHARILRQRKLPHAILKRSVGLYPLPCSLRRRWLPNHCWMFCKLS